MCHMLVSTGLLFGKLCQKSCLNTHCLVVAEVEDFPQLFGITKLVISPRHTLVNMGC